MKSFFVLSFFILTSLMILHSNMALAQLTEATEISFQTRAFRQDHQHETQDTGVGIFARTDLSYSKNASRMTFRGFGLMDKKDANRNSLTIEDAYISSFFGEQDQFKILFGYKIFNWSVCEAFHPADMINSRNLDSNIESLEKKGELNLELSRVLGNGHLALFYFPRAENPHFPGKRSRLGVGVDLKDPVWVKNGDKISTNNWAPQGALRLTQKINQTDFSFHIVSHLDRDQPLVKQKIFYITHPLLLIPVPVGAEYTPYYFHVLQLGATAQTAYEGWMFKFEGSYKDFRDEHIQIETSRGTRTPQDHTTLALGLEYIMNHQTGLDSNFFLEGQTFLGANTLRRSELSVFQRDLMLGWRLAFNDSMSKELNLYLIHDIERKRETLYNLAYSQRLTDYWKISSGLRLFFAKPKEENSETGLEVYHKDHYVYLNLTRFF